MIGWAATPCAKRTSAPCLKPSPRRRFDRSLQIENESRQAPIIRRNDCKLLGVSERHLLTEPFERFTFSPAGAAVYQLGQFGTAAKKLTEFDLKP